LLTYNEAGAAARLPEYIFVKHTPGFLTRLASGLSGQIDACFYQDLRDELRVDAPHLTIPHYSAQDPASGRSVNLFKDMVASKGAVFNTFRTAIDRDQADQMMDTLATLHAHFYGSARLTPNCVAAVLWVLRASGRNQQHGEGHERAMTEAHGYYPSDVARRCDEIWPTLIRNLAYH
jgi:hypothetical protein